MKKIEKAIWYLRNLGLKLFLKRLIGYPKQLFLNKNLSIALNKSASREEYFTYVYHDSKKRGLESVSGVGSTLEQTQNIVRELPDIFEKYNITSIFDAPCGDLNWMRQILKKYNGRYIGMDIVYPVITELKAKYSSERIEFVHGDVLTDAWPEADVLICRDFLFHLSNSDALGFLEKYKKSKIRYFITTSHKVSDVYRNVDIRTGEFRKLDLFVPPFCFPRDYLEVVVDFAPPEPERFLIMWRKDQLPDFDLNGDSFCS